MKTTYSVALVGNPNTGKSSLFNALSGLNQHVGNYPGVTVDLKKGSFPFDGLRFELIDLPGTYSLAARSPDEMVAVDLLLGRRPEEPQPDLILSVVDASNLDRHLYLTTQVMELGRPMILVVNMIDLAEGQGVKINLENLATETGMPVVALQANRGLGLDELRTAIRSAIQTSQIPTPAPLPDALEAEVHGLHSELNGDWPKFLTRRLLLDVGGATEKWFISKFGESIKDRVTAARTRLAEVGCGVPAVEAKARYAFIRRVTAKTVTKPAVRKQLLTDRIDRVLTHKIWGTLVFLTVLFLLFYSIFWLAEPLMAGIDGATKWLMSQVELQMSPGPLRSLLTDGILAGVGGVVKFLPQILILFSFIAVLEDCGYMARAAFLMDRLMSRCGLSGKSFIPLLSSVACAIPGIMATRVIENWRDRLATILVAPLMSCSARLPVYYLMIGLFLPDTQYSAWMRAAVLFAMYMIGFIVAPLMALLLRRTILRGERSLFVMELPSYKWPSLRGVVRRVYDAGWAFLRRAGTVILASMVLVWAALYFPTTDEHGVSYEARISDHTVQQEKVQASQVKAEWKRNSYLGRFGRTLEPVFAPLGWDWRIGMATLASFPAREVIVGTLGILYEVEETEGDEEKKELQVAIADDWKADPVRGKYAVPVALSVMVFFALCAQCASTLAVIRRETNSWLWPLFSFSYMTALAYLAAFLTFQIGKLLVGST
jgi:ferrous iron transport protein B